MTRIIIAGAGIGGLTLAHACLQRGMDVIILEKAKALKAVGAGIQIPPNAVKVLRALGLEDAIAKYAFRPQSIEARMGESGREVFSIPLAQAVIDRWGAPYFHIHRADYIRALSETLPDGVLRFGHSVMRYDITRDGVRAHFDSSEHLEADVLIGADGIKSTVREQMLGPQPATFTGNVAWRATVPLDRLGEFAPRPTACAWFGRGRHAVTYRLGADGKLANFVGVVERTDWTEEGWSIEGAKKDALSDFADWHLTITTLIKEADTLHKWALFDRDPLPRWSEGPVGLLGDAAHPMLPFLAQGAAMAVEDAWVLANEVSKTSPSEALKILCFKTTSPHGKGSSRLSRKYADLPQTHRRRTNRHLWPHVDGGSAGPPRRASPHGLALRL